MSAASPAGRDLACLAEASQLWTGGSLEPDEQGLGPSDTCPSGQASATSMSREG